MKHSLSRRDFLKLAGIIPLGIAAPPLVKRLGATQLLQGEKKNVLVVVFDALSAYNISLYGYERKTMPNLARLAKRATVYHNHFAAGNFTTPGTASLLTMTLPWTHRAIRMHGRVQKSFENKNIFHVFDDYYRMAYSHNPLVNTLFEQFQVDMNEFVPRQELFINNDGLIHELFPNDDDISTVSWARAMKRTEEGYSYSLFLSHLYEKYNERKIEKYKDFFPYGLPYTNIDNYFMIEQGTDWIGDHLAKIPQPFFIYFHFFPPHYPYKPRREYAGTFVRDSWKSLDKPNDIFSGDRTYEFLEKWRAYYDEFILNVDSEFGRLFDMLESSGILDDTWVVFTSDHGEMFERGIWGHTTPTFYQPVTRIPLLIFEPGQQTGKEIHTPTSAIDLMPTLLHVTGHSLPDWVEGSVLPPYTPQIFQLNKGVYAVQARFNDPALPLTEATIMYVQDNHKLVYYFGYEELGSDGERIQLFDIKADPDELNDLSVSKKDVSSELLAKVKSKLREANQSFLPG